MQQCGICSVLADLFRRIMCIGGSRRGSGESYYQELEEDERRGGISVERTDPTTIFIRMVGPVVSSTRSRHLSESDWLLLETLDTGCQRPLHTGRFLTMHKRRRKRLTTRSLTQDPALLDDIHHGQVQCVLDRVWKWPFNAFTLDTVTGGRSLPVLCVHLFHWYGLMDHFNLDVVRVWKLFTLIEEGYHSTNPYHNSIHATDVTQAMHCFLQEEKIRMHLTPLEIMSALIAAVTHDLDHPGVNQPFLIATSNHLAALYEVTDPNTSVLENHHWRSAIGCLLESNISEQLGTCRPDLEQQISSLILATDITRQQEFLTRFKRYLDQSSLDLRLAEDRHFILQIALKCADISNPCRPWDVSRKWSLKVCEEFFRQGDYERRLNLPVTSLCDRQTTSIPKIQAGFFKFVVSPLFEEWHRFLGTDLSTRMMGFLRGNQCRWEALVQQEIAEETKTEISDAEVIDDDVCGSSEDEVEVSGSVELLLPLPRRPSLPCEENGLVIKVNRRHSVPLSMVRTLPLPRTIIRRESLPVGAHQQRSILPLEEGVVLQPTHSQLSLLSSTSTQHSYSGEARPVSAENLLPEPSIASITTSLEASRLSTVLHGAPQLTSRYLTRQQTFPPLQPFIRVRYMSTTAEMSSCSEVLREADSRSESSCSLECEPDRTECVSESEVVRGKREQVDSARDKGSKVAKLSESWSAQQHRWEKENVDPQRLGSDADLDCKGGLRRNSHQGLTRRRGSAPVGLLNRSEDGISSTALALRGSSDRFLRRGSVPIDVTRQRSRDVENVQRLDNLGNVIVTTRDNLNVRRGSAPCDIELRRIAPGDSVLVRSGSNNGGKSRGRKKVLRRRSSGGSEMFSVDGDGVVWQRWRREVLARRAAELPADHLARRRGSLPVEVLASTLSAGPTWRKAPSLRRL